LSELPVIITTIIASAFFAGMEIAFLTANKLRIELERNQGFIPAKVVSFFMKKPQQFIATTLVGNNISLVIYGIYTAELMEPFFHQYIHSKAAVLIISVIISTFIIVITAEFLPKALFRLNPNGLLNYLAIPFAIVYFIMFPIVFITIGLAEMLLKYAFKLNLEKSSVTFGRIDLDDYIKQFTVGSNNNESLDHEIKIFQNALDFGHVKARECMIPRPELIAMEITDSIQDVQEKFIATHLSKLLIYQENIDNIIGYVHSSEMFKKPATIKEILLPIAIVPETMPAREILTLLKQQRKSIAIVVDEFGGTAGMLTIEDVMEEIFGEIEDEHDKEDLTIEQLTEKEFLFSGRLEVDFINNKFQLNLPIKDEYETLAGLILYHYGSMPEPKDEITIEKFIFSIKEVSGNKIELLKLRLVD
jgi:CBS domain containing-hemolysin-like protein